MVRTAVRKACGKINLDADLSCSVGIACYPANGESAEDLLGRADREMHRRKRDEGYERRTTETHADLEDSLTV
jgi:GGDEF domain-containing protein